MTTFVHIEPGDSQRRAFARWCLAQTPRIETASASGSDVPVDLYPTIPPELLEGAYVDGYPYGKPQPQPEQAAPVKAPQKRSQPRQRRPRKAADK